MIIAGTNFNNGNVTGITFGGTPVGAGNFTIIDGQTLSVITPVRAAGAVSVVVTNPTGSGTLLNGYTYTTANVKRVQVQVTVTVSKQANIQWGVGTSADDTLAPRGLTILPFEWIIKDPEFGASNLVSANTTYFSNDATNNKTLTLSNVSKTNSTETINAITTDSLNWKAGVPASPNTFELQISMNGGPYQPLGTDQSTAVMLTNNLVIGADQPLILQFSTPTTISPIITGLPADDHGLH